MTCSFVHAEFQDAQQSSSAQVAKEADRIITVLPTDISAIDPYSGASGNLLRSEEKFVANSCQYYRLCYFKGTGQRS